MKILALYKFPVSYTSGMNKKIAEMGIDLRALYCKKIDIRDAKVKYIDEKDSTYILTEGFISEFIKDDTHLLTDLDPFFWNHDVSRIVSESNADGLFVDTSYWSPVSWSAMKAAKRNGIPITVKTTVEVNKKRNVFLKILKRIVVGKYLKLADAAVYEGNDQKEYLKHYGMKDEQLFSAPCSVDNDYYREEALKFNREDFRNEIGADNNTILLSFLGYLRTRKRAEDIVRAAGILQKRGYDIRVVLIGDGEERENIEKCIVDNGISDIYITGALSNDQVGRYLKASDIFVLPSRNDASPKALNEAMNFALPILVSDGIETAKELLRVGENGYMFHVGDIDELVEGILKISEDRTNLKNMGEMSYKIVGASGYEQAIQGWLDSFKYGHKIVTDRNTK